VEEGFGSEVKIVGAGLISDVEFFDGNALVVVVEDNVDERSRVAPGGMST